jgi:hypothetical protein
MSGTTLRIIIAGVLGFHGIGHLMGVIPGLGLIAVAESSPAWLKGWSSHSWLLSGLLGNTVARVLSILLFLVAFASAAGAALGLLGWLVPYERWRALAIVSSVVSLVAVALYWNALIYLFPHKMGAIGVSAAVLIGLLWLNWPSQTALGY